MKQLIIYNEEEVINVSDYVEGTAVATLNSFMVEQLTIAKIMLSQRGVNTELIDSYNS